MVIVVSCAQMCLGGPEGDITLPEAVAGQDHLPQTGLGSQRNEIGARNAGEYAEEKDDES